MRDRYMTRECIIKVENMTKSFGKDVVLKNINTEICKGDIVAIIGPSGCGKSTFIRTLNLLEQPTEGAIYVDGVNIMDKKVDINKIRQKVGMVFQHFNLFSLPIAQFLKIIAFGLKSVSLVLKRLQIMFYASKFSIRISSNSCLLCKFFIEMLDFLS